jgi:hypothetical protein
MARTLTVCISSASSRLSDSLCTRQTICSAKSPPGILLQGFAGSSQSINMAVKTLQASHHFSFAFSLPGPLHMCEHSSRHMVL